MSERSMFDITHDHGEAMYIIGLKHAVAMIELHGADAADHLKAKIEAAEEIHSRWDAEHRETCGECHQEWLDEAREMNQDNQE